MLLITTHNGFANVAWEPAGKAVGKQSIWLSWVGVVSLVWERSWCVSLELEYTKQRGNKNNLFEVGSMDSIPPKKVYHTFQKKNFAAADQVWLEGYHR